MSIVFCFLDDYSFFCLNIEMDPDQLLIVCWSLERFRGLQSVVHGRVWLDHRSATRPGIWRTSGWRWRLRKRMMVIDAVVAVVVALGVRGNIRQWWGK